MAQSEPSFVVDRNATAKISSQIAQCCGLLPYLFVFVIFGLLYYYFKRPKGIPPGPIGVPFLGYAPFLGTKPQEKIFELSKTYGNIFSFYIGDRLTIVLNDYEAIKVAFIDNADVFANREPGFVHCTLNGSEHDTRVRGLTMTNGEQWRTMRRFALTTLRNLGMGKSRLESRILEEIDFLVQTLKAKNLEPVEPDNQMIACIANIMFAVSFDKRFDHGDPNFMLIVDFLIVALPLLSNIGVIQLFPWLRLIPGKYKEFFQRFKRDKNRLQAIFRNELKLHEKEHEYGEVRSYVDAFMEQQEKETRQDTSSQKYFDEDELVVSLSNLFGAGAETTATSITWAHYFMVLHPEIQKRVQAEIDAKVPRDRQVMMEDKVNLTYVEAVCQEVQRLGNVVPLSIARSTTEEINILGYRLPKRTYVMPNLWFIHRDPRYWKDPEEFNPDRFLDEEGHLLNPPYFMPFCVGKRHCPGESLAKMELFLFVANVLQKFNLELPAGYNLRPPEEYVNGLTVRPPQFEAIFVPRD